jgi:hypothetical protein
MLRSWLNCGVLVQTDLPAQMHWVLFVGGSATASHEEMAFIFFALVKHSWLLCRYHQHVNGHGPPRWLLCHASRTWHPETGDARLTVVQMDITDAYKVRMAHQGTC